MLSDIIHLKFFNRKLLLVENNSIILSTTLLLLTILFSPLGKAEGSRELISHGGYRPYLQFLKNPLYGIPRTGIIKVFVKQGEVVKLGSSVSNAFGDPTKDIVYRSPSDIEGYCNVDEMTGFGFIDTLIKENAGPLPHLGGYLPCEFTASEEGIYEIEFHSSTNKTSNTNAPPRPVQATSNFPTDMSQGINIAAWDVSVFNEGVEQKGRAYANYLPMDTRGYEGFNLKSVLYVLTHRGYLYRIDANNLEPHEFFFFANNKGFTDQNGNPLLRSVPLVPLKEARFRRPHLDDTLSDVTHKIFFNPPDENDLPKDIPVRLPRQKATWLLSSQPTPPNITNSTFIGKEGTPFQAGYAPLGGTFSFEVDQKSSFTIVIDANNNGIQGDANDRVITGQAQVGKNAIPWDGLDGKGDPLPPQNTPYAVEFSFSVDDIHFPFLDMESNPNGLILQRVNLSTLAVESNIVYYNNEGLSGTGAPNPFIATQGIDGSGGVQKFTNRFGNERGIDTWTMFGAFDSLANGGILIKKADLSVTKTHEPLNPVAGGLVAYTITVQNDGPSDAVGIKVKEDAFPKDKVTITGPWTCQVKPLSSKNRCGKENGTGLIDTTVDLENGASALFTIAGQVKSLAKGTIVNNSVTITRPNDVVNPQGTLPDIKTETAKDTFTITPPNEPPQADNKTASTANDIPVKLPPLTATDPDGSIVSYTIPNLLPELEGILFLGHPEEGGIALLPGTELKTLDEVKNIWFQPHQEFIGKSTFTYTVQDDLGANSEPATVTITVTAAPMNHLPVAENISVTPPVLNDSLVAQQLPSLRATDPDDPTHLAGQILSYTISFIFPPEEGILYLGDPAQGGTAVTEGQILHPSDIAQLYFTPNNAFIGEAHFTYTATDGKNATSETATVTIPVNAPDKPPTALDKTAASTPNNKSVKLPSLEASDDGQIVSYTIKTLPSSEQGILYLGDPITGTPITPEQILQTSDITHLHFEPHPSFTGEVNFTYLATDDTGAISNTATITVPVTAPITNQKPLVEDITAPTTPSITSIQVPPLIGKDDGTIVSYTIETIPPENEGVVYLGEPTGGGTPLRPGQILSPNEVANLHFKPHPDFKGTSQFTYSATDDQGMVSDPAKVTLPVTTQETSPVANDDQGITMTDKPVMIPILSNDIGVTPDHLTITTPPTQGKVTVNPDGTVTYTPNPGFSGVDTFIYQVCDATGKCVSSKVTVTVSSSENSLPLPSSPPTLSVSFGGDGHGSVISTPQGIDCDDQITTCQHSYDFGTSVVLTPAPAPDSEFNGWGGHADCSDGNIFMITDVQCIAYFGPRTQSGFNLSVAKIGGEGKISTQDKKLDCTTQCQERFPSDMPVVLTATPQPGFIFKAWEGDCTGTSPTITLIMSQDKSCQARFEALPSVSSNQFPLTVTKVGSGNGMVKDTMDLNCGEICAHNYPARAQISLTATPDENSLFLGWSGDCQGRDQIVTVTMDQAKGCVALFDVKIPALPPPPNTEALTVQNPTPYKATIMSDIKGIEITPNSSQGAKSTAFYPIGTEVNLTAIPEPGVKFVRFDGDEDCRDGKVTITQDIYCYSVLEPVSPGVIQFSSPTYTVDELGNRVATISVTRTEGCDGLVTVDYGTQAVSAQHLADYTNVTGTLTWAEGDCNEKTFTVPIQDDLLIEGNETLQLNLSSVTGNAQLGDLDKASLTIIDNDQVGSNGASCYNLAPCQACCPSCQTTQDNSNQNLKSLVVTVKVGETMPMTLNEGQGELSIHQFPDNKFALLESWTPQGKGAAELIIRGVHVGTTSLIIIDNAVPPRQATVYINVIADGKNSQNSSTGTTPGANSVVSGSSEQKTLYTKIEVGQSFTVTVSGKGELSLNELPNKAFASLETWRVIGNSAELSVTGTSVGTTKAVIIDQNNPPQKTIIEIEVIPNQTKPTETNNPQVPSITTPSPPAGYTYNPTTGKYSNPETGREWVGSSSPPPGYQYDPSTGKYTDPQTGKTWTGTHYEYDPGTGKYYDPQTGDYYSYNPLKDPTLVNPQGNDIVTGISNDFLGEQCSPANGLQLPVQGQTSASPACFLSKLSTVAGSQANHKMFAQSDAQALRLSTTIYPDPKHVGQSAEILLVGVRTTLTWETRYMRDLENHWLEWDDEISHLQATQSYTLLPERVEVSIYEGDLSFAPGEYTAFVGYRLRDGTVVHNGAAPLHFYIGNASSVNLRQSTAKTSYSQEVYTTSYFDLHVHNNHKPGKFGNHQAFENDETLNLNSFVRIDPRHVGQAADIVMWALYQHGEERVTYARVGGEWEVWEGQWGSLKSAQYYDRLPEVLYIPIYWGQLSNLPGQLTLYVGYRLSEEVMVFNGADPIQFTVAEMPGTVREASRWVTVWVKEPGSLWEGVKTPLGISQGGVEAQDVGQRAQLMMKVFQGDSELFWQLSTVVLPSLITLFPQVALPEGGQLYLGYQLENGRQVWERVSR